MKGLKSSIYKITSSRNAFLVVVVLLLSSCGRSIYVPNSVNTPMLSDSGEVSASIMTGTDGFGAQAAYALSSHFAFIGDFSHSVSASRHIESNRHYKNRNVNTLSELGFGYFQKLGPQARFEVYGGLGKDYRNLVNYSKRVDSVWYSHIENKCNLACSRLFLQTDISKFTRIADFSFGARIVGLDFQTYNYRSLYLDVKDNVIKSTATTGHKPAALIEPVLSMRFKYRSLKLFYQMGLAMPFGKGFSRKEGNAMEPLFMNVGLSFKIPGK